MPTQPRDITYPIQLTTAELAFLLTLVHATTLQGGDDRALFPAAETERDALWLQGREQLIADGWLVRKPDREVYAINDQLLLLIAALAAPEVVLLTERKTATATFGVAHYIAHAHQPYFYRTLLWHHGVAINHEPRSVRWRSYPT